MIMNSGLGCLRRGHDLFCGTIQKFVSKDQGKPRKNSMKIAYLRQRRNSKCVENGVLSDSLRLTVRVFCHMWDYAGDLDRLTA
jgi:hypothetical protein